MNTVTKQLGEKLFNLIWDKIKNQFSFMSDGEKNDFLIFTKIFEKEEECFITPTYTLEELLQYIGIDIMYKWKVWFIDFLDVIYEWKKTYNCYLNVSLDIWDKTLIEKSSELSYAEALGKLFLELHKNNLIEKSKINY